MNQSPQYAGPPPGADATDLWSKLTQRPRPHKDFTFKARGQDATVRLIVLTEQELMRCRANADAFAKQLLREKQAAGESNPGQQDIYRNEIVVQVVCLACRDPRGQSINSMAYPNVDMARGFFTSDELSVQFQAYCDWQAESGPILSSMTPEEMDAWIEKLQEGGARAPLALLSSELRDRLLLHSVSRIPKSSTANGSAGSPPSEPSSAVES